MCVPIGSMMVDPADWRRMVELTTNFQARMAEVIDRERTAGLQRQADAIQLISEGHKAAVGSLEKHLANAQAEIEWRGQENRLLIVERHADVNRIGAVHERAVTAEQRHAESTDKKEIELAGTAMTGETLKMLVVTLAKFGTDMAPLLLAARGRTSDESVRVVDTTMRPAAPGGGPSLPDTKPPAPLWELVQLLWSIRDPGLARVIGNLIVSFGELPQLLPVGQALREEAPEAFAAAVAALIAMNPKPNGANGAAPSQPQQAQPQAPPA